DESRALRLAEQPDLVAALYERMRTLDEALGYEVTRVLRDPEFRRLEAAWRGVDHLLRHLGTYEQSQLYVLTIGRGELEKGLQVDGAIQHWLMEEFAQFGGQPKAVLVLDFEFMQQPRDVAILAAVARLAAMVNVQVLASAAPGLLDADDDAVIDPLHGSRLQKLPEYAAWRRLRANPSTQRLGLVVPRAARRAPHALARPGHGDVRDPPP